MRLRLVVVARCTKSDPACVVKVVELTLWEGRSKRHEGLVTLSRCSVLAEMRTEPPFPE